jgi:hypothetical protein
MTHYVKIRPEYYRDILAGKKRAAVRLNDRGYAVGDTVVKRVYANSAYTGEALTVVITHIIANSPGFLPFAEGYICFSFLVEEDKPCCI